MKRVLITGASSGIGKQLAHDYLQNGWRVVACGRDRQKLQQLSDSEQVEYRALYS